MRSAVLIFIYKIKVEFYFNNKFESGGTMYLTRSWQKHI